MNVDLTWRKSHMQNIRPVSHMEVAQIIVFVLLTLVEKPPEKKKWKKKWKKKFNRSELRISKK